MSRTPYNEEHVQFILEAYKSGMLLKDICKKMKSMNLKTVQGFDYKTSTVSFIANKYGLRRFSPKKMGIRATPQIKKPSNQLSEVEDLLSSNLSSSLKLKYLKIISKDL